MAAKKMIAQQMKRKDWVNTPYAASKAGDADRDIARLLDRWEVTSRQFTESPGPNGRPAVTLRFVLKGRIYRFGVECLDTEERVSKAERLHQVKRVIYWTLKPILENLLLFMPAEQALLPYLEGNDGFTVYEAMVPHVDKLDTRRQLGVWGTTQQKMLAAPPAEGGTRD